MNPYTKRGSLPKLSMIKPDRRFRRTPDPTKAQLFIFKTFLMRTENRVLTVILSACIGLLGGLWTISEMGLDNPMINTIEGKKLEKLQMDYM